MNKIIIRKSLLKHFPLFLLGVIYVAMSVWFVMQNGPKVVGIFGIVFFSFALIIFLFSYFYHHTILVFDEIGVSIFTSAIALQLGHIPWEDIESLSLFPEGKLRTIMVTLKKTELTVKTFPTLEFEEQNEGEDEFYYISVDFFLANKRASSVLHLMQNKLDEYRSK